MIRKDMWSLLRKFNVVLKYSGWLICIGLLFSSSIIAIPQEVLPLPVSTQFNSVGQTNTENVTSIICNGSLTLNTTTTIQWAFPVGNYTHGRDIQLFTEKFINISWMSFVEKRSSTITIPFTVNLNYSYASNVYDMLEGDILGWSNSTVSWIGNWSLTNITGCSRFIYQNVANGTNSFECIPTSNNPGSGKVSGSASGQVSGLYRNGQVFFNFNPYLRSLVFSYPPYSSPGGNQFFENVIDYSRIDGSYTENYTAGYPYPMVWRYVTSNQGFGYSVYNPIFDGVNGLWFASGGVDGDGVKRGWMNRTQIKFDLGDSANLEIPFSGEYDFLDDSYYFSHSFGSIDQSHIKGGHIIFEYTGMVKLKVRTPTPLANITETSGKVEINPAQGNTWESAVEGSALRNGDRVRTGKDGKAKVTFPGGSYIVSGSNSFFTVGGVEAALRSAITRGKFYIRWLKQYAKKFEVRTPIVVIAVRGTEFTVEVTEDNATTITVFEGIVNVQDRTSGSNVTVAANQTLTVHPVPGGLTPQEMSALITTVDPASVDQWWRAPTDLSCSVSKNTITQGDGIVVSGSINVSLSGKTVTLTYKKPDESILNRTVTTGSDGSYNDSYNPDTAGTWSVTASWAGDSLHNGATSSTRSLTVNSVTFILFTPLGMALTGGIILLAVIVVVLILRRRPKIPGNPLSFFGVVF